MSAMTHLPSPSPSPQRHQGLVPLDCPNPTRPWEHSLPPTPPSQSRTASFKRKAKGLLHRKSNTSSSGSSTSSSEGVSPPARDPAVARSKHPLQKMASHLQRKPKAPESSSKKTALALPDLQVYRRFPWVGFPAKKRANTVTFPLCANTSLLLHALQPNELPRIVAEPIPEEAEKENFVRKTSGKQKVRSEEEDTMTTPTLMPAAVMPDSPTTKRLRHVLAPPLLADGLMAPTPRLPQAEHAPLKRPMLVPPRPQPHHQPSHAQTAQPHPMAMLAPPPRPRSPPKLSDFELLKTIGTGTFGRVWLSSPLTADTVASDPTRKKYYAIKVLRKEVIVRLRQIDHVRSDRQLLSLIRHPFLIHLYTTFQNAEHLFLLMEYVPGGELFTHLRAAGRFDHATARFYTAQLVLALDYLHALHIAYRDLKPENLLLDAQGHIKITDFGFAKRVIDRYLFLCLLRFPSRLLNKCSTFTVCGTPDYIAPEIILNLGHGTAVDWWALGVLLYEMLFGYPPFHDQNHFKTYEKITNGKVKFLTLQEQRAHGVYIEVVAEDLIRRLLVKDRTKRIGNLQNGSGDVQKHPFFRDISWQALYYKQVQAPIRPFVAHPGDTRQFMEYPPDEQMDRGLMPDLPRRYRDSRPEERANDAYRYAFADF